MTQSTPLAPERSALYHSPRDLPALRERLVADGIDWSEIELGGAQTKDQVLAAFARALRLPATFGHNWDALADALQEMRSQTPNARVLHLRHAGSAARALAAHWATLLEVLATTITYWRSGGKAFIVFVDEAKDLPAWT
jgi:hypothetical protein